MTTSVVGERSVSSEPVEFYVGEGKDIVITVVDPDGVAIDMTGKTLVLSVEHKTKVDYFTVEDGSITKTGASGNILTITVPYSSVSFTGSFNYSVRDVAAPFRLWARGVFTVAYGAKAD